MIYFAAPDLARPSGGVRTIYRSVDLLNSAGLPAAVLHGRPGFRCTWFDNSTVVVHPPVSLGSPDVLVVPESYLAELPLLALGVRKVVFNQNAYRTFRSSKAASGSPGDALTKNPDVAGMLVVSEDNQRYLELAFPGVTIVRLHHWIDSTVFHVDLGARRRKIAVMPRKRRDEFAQVLGILGGRGALDGWQVETLEERPEAEVAVALREAVLFVSLSRAEGFGLPPAEAMASGCHVIGFHGMGGREIFRTPFAQPIEDGDVVALAMAVEEFLATFDERAAELERLALAGAEFITSTYSREQATADLVRFFGPLEQAAGRDVDAVVGRRDLVRESPFRSAARRRLRRLGRKL